MIAAPDTTQYAETWRSLQAVGAVGTPFMTWEWFSAMAEIPDLAEDCSVLVIKRAGQAVGLFPIERRRGADGLRTVCSAGSRLLAPDHLEVIACPPDRRAVAEAVVRHLTSARDWDMIDLDGLVDNGFMAQALSALGPPRFLPRAPEPEPVPYLPLNGDDAVDVRRKLQRYSRRGMNAARSSGGGFFPVTDLDQATALLEELMEQHNARFGDASTVFSTPGLRRFHLAAARRMMEAGLARISVLVVEGKNAGLDYSLLWDGRAYGYQGGMLPDVGYAPGRTVKGQTILAVADEGFAEFDLLRGAERYKYDLATATRYDVRVRILRLTGRTAAWALRHLPSASAALRARLRTTYLSSRARVVERRARLIDRRGRPTGGG